MLQARRTQVRFPMRLDFSFQPHYGPRVLSASNRVHLCYVNPCSNYNRYRIYICTLRYIIVKSFLCFLYKLGTSAQNLQVYFPGTDAGNSFEENLRK